MKEKVKKYILENRHMKYVDDIFESYEDVCIVSVIDKKLGLIEVIYPESYEEVLNEIVKDLRLNGIDLWEYGGKIDD